MKCQRCNKSTAVGHETTYCSKYGSGGRLSDEFIPRHFCCPGNCEFDRPAELADSVAFWERQANSTLLRWTREQVGVEKDKVAFSKKVHPEALTG